MKRTKRIISILLAAALAVSLGFSALADWSAGYPDYDKIVNKTAVNVLTILNVMSGREGGNFDPQGQLTREQAAKLVTYVLMAGDDKSVNALATTSAPFTDVPADRWSAGCIAFCVGNGIIAGNGDGTFSPEDTVTGYNFAKMLLVALGYDATIQGYTGSNWTAAVKRDAVACGAASPSYDFGKTMTRDEAALMMFNIAGKANMVTYASKGTTVTAADGTKVVTGASAPTHGFGRTLVTEYFGGKDYVFLSVADGGKTLKTSGGDFTVKDNTVVTVTKTDGSNQVYLGGAELALIPSYDIGVVNVKYVGRDAGLVHVFLQTPPDDNDGEAPALTLSDAVMACGFKQSEGSSVGVLSVLKRDKSLSSFVCGSIGGELPGFLVVWKNGAVAVIDEETAIAMGAASFSDSAGSLKDQDFSSDAALFYYNGPTNFGVVTKPSGLPSADSYEYRQVFYNAEGKVIMAAAVPMA